MGKKLSEMSLPSVDKGKHGFAGREAPLTVLSSLLYGSKAASSALSGTLPASEKLLRTPALQKGRDGKAAGGVPPLSMRDPQAVQDLQILNPRGRFVQGISQGNYVRIGITLGCVLSCRGHSALKFWGVCAFVNRG